MSVFYVDDKESYEALKPSARKLGEAFQKINFLRDIRQDFEERGRIYFPELDLKSFTVDTKRKIEAEIREDFLDARTGIRKLHKEARMGVFIAYRYYYRLLKKISKIPPEKLMKKRVRIDNFSKLIIIGDSLLRNMLGFL